MRRRPRLPDLVLTITYADDTQDICVITEENQATWTAFEQPKTTDRNIAIMQEAKDLKAWLLAIGAKSISLAPPVVPPP